MIKWCMFTLCLLLTACSDPPKTQQLKRESVVDQVGVLSSGEKGQLKEKISLIKKDANVDIVVYITDDYDTQDIETSANEIFNQMGIGKESRGILILIFPEKKRMRVEVGRGIEGELTDTQAGKTMEKSKPLFRQGNYYLGIYSIMYEIQRTLNRSKV